MLAIFGTGGFGRELVASGRAAIARGDFDELVFVVDEPGDPVLGHRVISPEELGSEDSVVFALGDPALRRRVSARFHQRAPALIDPLSHVGPGVQLGEGAVICAYSTITASAQIGRHFQCNIYSYVAHDCIVGDFVTFAPKVCCNGNVHIGEGAYIGTGAILRQGTSSNPLRIGAGAVIGMGAVVTKDVPDGATVVGNPARPLVKK